MFGLFGSGSDEDEFDYDELTEEEQEQFDFWGTILSHDTVRFYRSEGQYMTILYIDGGNVVDARCNCDVFEKPSTGNHIDVDHACAHIKEATRNILHQYEQGVIQTDDKSDLPIPEGFNVVLQMMD